jgi:hypothetical protein
MPCSRCQRPARPVAGEQEGARGWFCTGAARAARGGGRNCIETGGDHSECRLGILERHLQLLVVELLGACAEAVAAQRGDDVVQPGQFCLGMVVDGAKSYDLGLSLRLNNLQDGNFRLLLLVGGTQRGEFFIMRMQLRHGRDEHGAQSVRIRWKVSLKQHRGAVHRAARAASTGELRRHRLAAAMDPAPV